MRVCRIPPVDGSYDIWTAGFGSVPVAQERLEELIKKRTAAQADSMRALAYEDGVSGF
jgi:hypothetical protein